MKPDADCVVKTSHSPIFEAARYESRAVPVNVLFLAKLGNLSLDPLIFIGFAQKTELNNGRNEEYVACDIHSVAFRLYLSFKLCLGS